MKIDYRDDQNAGAGHGKLLFTEILAPDEPWQAAIQRSSDHNYLTDSGRWVGEVFFNSLPGRATAEGALELDLGPDFVNALDTRETYRVSIKGADGSVQTGRLNLSSITHSQGKSLENTPGPQPEKPRPQEPGPLPQSVPPKPEPTRPEPERPVQPQPAPSQPGEPLPIPEQPAQTKAKWPRYALLALLAIACVAWYLFDQRDKGNPPPAAPPTTQAQRNEPEPKGLTPQERVAEFFNGRDKTAQKAMALFDELPKTSATDQDAAYRLLYFAANAGDGPALLKYGQCLDPSTPQWGGIDKDAVLAWQAYGQAGASADAARQELRKWLESQSQAGNAKARAWLEEIK